MRIKLAANKIISFGFVHLLQAFLKHINMPVAF